MEKLNPQILTWILLEIEKPQTVIPGRNKALYYIENLYFTTKYIDNYYFTTLWWGTRLNSRRLKVVSSGIWCVQCIVGCVVPSPLKVTFWTTTCKVLWVLRVEKRYMRTSPHQWRKWMGYSLLEPEPLETWVVTVELATASNKTALIILNWTKVFCFVFFLKVTLTVDLLCFSLFSATEGRFP